MVLALGLTALGLLLIFLEFYVPGGIIGILGGISLVIGAVLFFKEELPLWVSIIYLILLLVLLVGTIRFALWRIRCKGKADTLFLMKDQEGYQASSYRKELIGKKGKTFSDLKPSGHVVIEGEKFQALSESGYIEQGEEIIVIRGSGAHIVVRTI